MLHFFFWLRLEYTVVMINSCDIRRGKTCNDYNSAAMKAERQEQNACWSPTSQRLMSTNRHHGPYGDQNGSTRQCYSGLKPGHAVTSICQMSWLLASCSLSGLIPRVVALFSSCHCWQVTLVPGIVLLEAGALRRHGCFILIFVLNNICECVWAHFLLMSLFVRSCAKFLEWHNWRAAAVLAPWRAAVTQLNKQDGQVKLSSWTRNERVALCLSE